MVKFETGKSYFCTSACDHTCVWTFRVTRRTAKTIWIQDDEGKIRERRVSVYRDEEQVSPFGSYSMSAVLGAGRIVRPLGRNGEERIEIGKVEAGDRIDVDGTARTVAGKTFGNGHAREVTVTFEDGHEKFYHTPQFAPAWC